MPIIPSIRATSARPAPFVVAALLTFSAATFGTAAIAHGPVAWLIAGTATATTLYAMTIISWALIKNPDAFNTEAELRARLNNSDNDLDKKRREGMLLDKPEVDGLKTSKPEFAAAPESVEPKDNESGW